MKLEPFDGELDAPGGFEPFTGELDAPTSTLAPRSRTMGEVAGDIGVTALKGAIGLPQAVVGLGSLVSGGRVGKAVQDAGIDFEGAGKIADSLYSDPQKRANAAVRGADGFLPTLQAGIENPSAVAATIGESLPQMVGGAGVARGLLGAVPKVAPWLAGAIGEGVMGAGGAAEQARGTNDDGLLTGRQAGAAAASGVGTAAFGAIGGKVANRLGLGDADTLLAQGAKKAVEGAAKSPAGALRQVLGSAVSEGALEELPQSVQEQIWQNYGAGRPLTEGVGNAAALGLLSGAAMGGAGGGFNAAMRGRAPALDKTIEAVAPIAAAGSVDEAIDAANAALDAPISAAPAAVAAVDNIARLLGQDQPATITAPQPAPVATENPDVSTALGADGTTRASDPGRGDLAAGSGFARDVLAQPAGGGDVRPAAGDGRDRGQADAVGAAGFGTDAVTAEANANGTLTVRGDPALIQSLLAQAGVTSMLPAKNGVLVARSQAAQAGAAVADFTQRAAPPIAPPSVAPSIPAKAQQESTPVAISPVAPNVQNQPPAVEPVARAEAPVTAVDQAPGAVGSDARAEPAAAAPAEPLEAPRVAPPKISGGRSARGRAQDANPFRAFLGKHGISTALRGEFAPGNKESRSAMVPGYGPMFRKTGKPIDMLAQAAVEEGFLAEPDEGALYEMVARAMRGERIDAAYRADTGEAVWQKQQDREAEAYADRQAREADLNPDGLTDEELARRELEGLSDAELFQLDDSPAMDEPWNGEAESLESVMRAAGVPQEQIDAIASREAEPQEPAAPRVEDGGRGARADEARAGQAPRTAGRRDEAPRPRAEPAGRVDADAADLDAAGDITLTIPIEGGKTARLTVSARRAMDGVDERITALEKVRRCLG